MAHAGGRPTKYSASFANKICGIIATSSQSLRTICNAEDMPSVASVLNWLNTKQEFLAQYNRAKELQADFLAEEMIDISDDGSNDFMTIVRGDQEYTVENKEWTSRSKLRVDTRKWIASKLKPKKYGDRLDLTSDGERLAPNQIINLPTESLAKLEKIIADASSQAQTQVAANNEENTTGDT